MFTIDSSITDLKVRDRNLFKVLFSMNNHQVANPEMSLEEARSYVFFFKDGGKFQAYVALHFIPSDRRMFYSYSSPSFGESEMIDVEEEARSFAEGLGAMLDEIHFSGLSTEDKNNWIDAQELLSQKKKEPEPAPAPAQEPAPAAVVQPAVVEQTPPAPAPQPVTQQPLPPVQPPPAPIQAVPAPAPAPIATTSVPIQFSEPAPAVSPPTPLAGPRALQPTQQSAPQAPVVEEVQVPVDVQVSPAQYRVPKKPTTPAHEEATLSEDGPNGTASAMDDVLDEAVRAGVVKAPKAKLKKDIRTSAVSIGREKEALARLLSSF